MAQPSRILGVVVAVGGLAVCASLFVRYQQTVQRPIALATDVARKSSEVRDAIGKPLRFGRLPQARVQGKNAHPAIRVRGAHGDGLLIEWAQKGPAGWQLCSLLFRDESTTTDVILVSEAATHCARQW